MRLIIFFFLFFTLHNIKSFGVQINDSGTEQLDTAKTIESIKSKYQKISSGIASYRKATKDIYGQSSEGGQAEVYYDGDNLKKMVITHFGEIGKQRTEYYVDGGKVFFIYIKRTMYDKPIYEKGSKVLNIEEDRCYFFNDKMIRWIDKSKKIVNPSTDIFLSKEKELLNATLLKFED
jgi:hypothetical protein